MSSNIAHRIAEVQRKAAAFLPNDEPVRRSLLQAARSLVNALETPGERIAHMTYSEPFAVAATRTLIDLNIFHILAESEGPHGVKELAHQAKADPKLLSRLLKHVASEGLIAERGPDEYVANEMARTLAAPGGQGAVRDLFNPFQIAGDLPAFLKETRYVNPTDKDRSLWKYSKQTDLHYFDYIFSPGREEMVEAFKNHMAFKLHGREWFQDNAIMNKIFGDVKLGGQDVLMIDIGGNSGHDILGFKKAHRDLSGRLVLQDLPAIISSLDSEALLAQGVEAMAHDMFTAQPVKEAKVYYLKLVLHDWPAEQCKKVLAQLKPALKPGYSRILLNEFVVSEQDAHWMETSLDLLMMAVHSAQERREAEWRDLVQSVDGLKVRKIWDVEGGAEKIIEIEVV